MTWFGSFRVEIKSTDQWKNNTFLHCTSSEEKTKCLTFNLTYKSSNPLKQAEVVNTPKTNETKMLLKVKQQFHGKNTCKD